MKTKQFLSQHKRTLSGVVAEVNNLNDNSVKNKEYNFTDLLGDINYIDDGQGSKGKDSKEYEGPEEGALTKKEIAAKQKTIEAPASPKAVPPQTLQPAKQSSEVKPQPKSRLSKYLVFSDNGQELATSLSVNSKGEANSITSPAVKGGDSGNAQDSKSQPSSYEVLDDNVTSSDSTTKNKGDSKKSGGSGSKQQEEEKKASSSEESWQEAELTESMVHPTQKSKSTTNIKIERYNARFEEKMRSEIAKISQKYEQQIQNYQKKGLNPLTKKLMEKAKNEQTQAVAKKKEELEQEKMRNIDKIKAGLFDELDEHTAISLDVK